VQFSAPPPPAFVVAVVVLLLGSRSVVLRTNPFWVTRNALQVLSSAAANLFTSPQARVKESCSKRGPREEEAQLLSLSAASTGHPYSFTPSSFFTAEDKIEGE
jgi:hypothetical protein